MAYTQKYIISPSFIKDTTEIHSNTDNDLLEPIILDCQRLFVKYITGSDLMNEILDEIAAGSVSAANQTLLNDHLIPAIQKWVVAEYIRRGSYKYTNKGTVNMSGDGGNTTSSTELIQMRQDYLNMAEQYASDATLWLMENEATYPLYCDYGDGLDVTPPDRDQFETGFNLDTI